MKPIISTLKNGTVKVKNRAISYDFYINAEGKIINRKRLVAPPERSGISLRTVSLHEAGELYDPRINEMIIGYRGDDKLLMSYEATDYFEEKKCKIKMLPLEEAISYWNRYEGYAVGLFYLPEKK